MSCFEVYPYGQGFTPPIRSIYFITWPLFGGSPSHIIPLGLLLLPHLYDGALLHGGVFSTSTCTVLVSGTWLSVVPASCQLFSGSDGSQGVRFSVTLFLRISRTPLAGGVLCPTCASSTNVGLDLLKTKRLTHISRNKKYNVLKVCFQTGSTMYLSSCRRTQS